MPSQDTLPTCLNGSEPGSLLLPETEKVDSSVNFRKSLASNLSKLQAVLIEEYESEVSSLRAENSMLLKRINASTPLQQGTEVSLDNLCQEAKSVRNGDNYAHCSLDGQSGGARNLQAAKDFPPNQRPPVAPMQPTNIVSSFVQQESPVAHHSHIKKEYLPDETTLAAEQMQAVICEAAPQLERSQVIRTGRQPKHSTRTGGGRSSGSMGLGSKDPSLVQRIVQNKWFEIASAAIILFNASIMSLQLQYAGFDIGYNIEDSKFPRTAVDTWPHANDVLLAFDASFNVIFCVELLLRIAAMKWHSLLSGWIWFDMIVIVISSVDSFGNGSLPVDPGMLRVLRLVRLARLLKILRALSSFDSLFLLLKAIYASFTAAVFAFLILALVQLCMGLFLCQILHMYLKDEDQDLQGRQKVFRYFGTFSKTILTMFEISMANWAGPARTLSEEVNEWFILLFVAYRCFFCFAVLKVISAVFITETNRVLEHDDELTIMKRARERIDFDKKVLKLVHAIESFDGEFIRWPELEEIVKDEAVPMLLMPLGFEPKDLEKLFWLLDDGQGRVPMDLFLQSIHKLRGAAKPIDNLLLLKLTHRINQHITELCHLQGIIDSTRMEELEEARCVNVI